MSYYDDDRYPDSPMKRRSRKSRTSSSSSSSHYDQTQEITSHISSGGYSLGYYFPTSRGIIGYMDPYDPSRGGRQRPTGHVADEDHYMASSSGHHTQSAELSMLHELEPHTTLLHFLSNGNPPLTGPMEDPSIRRRNAKSPNFEFIWWDIRNIRTWQDFNFTTIMSIPDLKALLTIPMPAALLPEPPVDPDLFSLGDKPTFMELATSFFCPKVSAALHQSIGSPSFSMAKASVVNANCDFAGAYATNGDYRACYNRVPGFVKSCREWHTLMQAGADSRRKEYLQVLSQLQRYMRENGTRYGYILTEQELVCVRAVTDVQGRPIFGCLDVSLPINWSQQGPGKMTICLALWYLHMLAKKDPLPGQYGWRLDVAPPEHGTRQYVMPKDPWIPQPDEEDLSIARKMRGWGDATEALSYGESLR